MEYSGFDSNKDYKNLPDSALRSFSWQWYWITSDRIGEFDDVCCRPIKQFKKVRAETKAYIKIHQSIPDEAPVSKIVDAFLRLLNNLDVAGENISEIYDWARTLVLELAQPGEDQGSFVVWDEAFVRWSTGQCSVATAVEQTVLDALTTSYRVEVLDPRKAFRERCKGSESEWLNNRKRRTEWDEVLWQHFFEKVYIDPATYLSDGYGTMLTREWWRRQSPKISKMNKEQFLEELVINIQNYGDPETMDWSLVRSMDQAMAIDRVPMFKWH